MVEILVVYQRHAFRSRSKKTIFNYRKLSPIIYLQFDADFICPSFKDLVVHHYAVDVFMINFPVPEMPSVLCIKHAINLTELQKRYDMALKVFWK